MAFIYLSQLIVPPVLLAWLAFLPPRSNIGFWLQAVGTALALFAAARTGVWLFPPWWAPYVYGVLLVVALLLGYKRRKAGSRLPRGIAAWAVAGLFSAVSVYSGQVIWRALAGTKPPAISAVELAFPFPSGTYLVVNGGTDLSINAHQESMVSSDPRFKPWRGNGYAIDLVALDAFGTRAPGFMPGSPAAYQVFGVPVVAPCLGSVVLAVDGLPDMSVPEFDRKNMAGNYVVLECGNVHVVMAHFRKGSVGVSEGEQVSVGQKIAEVGNSGGSNEPHLHIHAQRPGTREAPVSGDPLPARFAGQFLIRGDRLTVPPRSTTGAKSE